MIPLVLRCVALLFVLVKSELVFSTSSALTSFPNQLASVPSITNNELTLVVVFSRTSANSGYLFANSASATTDSRCLALSIQSEQLVFYYDPVNTALSRVTLTAALPTGASFDGSPHVVVLAMNTTHAEMFFDGASQKVFTISSVFASCGSGNGSGIALIGARAPYPPGSVVFVGTVNSLSMYDTRLTNGQIEAIGTSSSTSPTRSLSMSPTRSLTSSPTRSLTSSPTRLPMVSPSPSTSVTSSQSTPNSSKGGLKIPKTALFGVIAVGGFLALVTICGLTRKFGGGKRKHGSTIGAHTSGGFDRHNPSAPRVYEVPREPEPVYVSSAWNHDADI